MYLFGATSLEKLESCHPDLIKVAHAAIHLVDFSIICGHRDQETQDSYYEMGVSRLQYPHSKHNDFPSKAFDFAPFPIDWEDHKQFIYVAGIIVGVGHSLGVALRWGGDWSGNGRLNKKGSFNDYGHIELFERRSK